MQETDSMSGQLIMRHLRRGAGGLLLAVLATAASAQSERSIEAIDHVALDTNLSLIHI